MKTVAKKRVRSFVLLGILLALAAMAAAIWLFFYRNKSYWGEASAYVDGHIEVGDAAGSRVLETFYTTAPGRVIAPQPDGPQNLALMFVGVTEEAQTNMEILDLLRQKGIRASFALSASEALENPEFVDALLNDGHDLISNGRIGQGNLQNTAPQELLEDMQRSRQSLSASADKAVSLVYCDATSVTADILRSVAAGGYDALVLPDRADVLADGDLESPDRANTLLSRADGRRILVMNLRTDPQALADEPPVTAQKPAIDKQPDLDSDTKAQPQTVPLSQQVRWLLDAIVSQSLKTDYVRALPRQDGMDYLRTLAESPQASQVPVYTSCLTVQPQLGLGVLGLPTEAALDRAEALLQTERLQVCFFTQSQLTAAESTAWQRLSRLGCTLGLTDEPGTLDAMTAGDVLAHLDRAIQTLTIASGYRPSVYLVQDAKASPVLRTSAKLLGLRVILPESQEPEQGGLYLLDALDESALSALRTRAAGLTLTDMQTVLDRSGTIPLLTSAQVAALRQAAVAVPTQNLVFTAQRAVSPIFYGFGSPAAVRDAADVLSQWGGTGTFFATLEELTSCQETISYLLNQGHTLGIVYKPSADYPQSFEAVANYLNSWNRYASWRYGVSGSLVLMPSTEPEEETRQVIGAMGCRLVSGTYSVVKTEDRDITREEVPAAMERMAKLRVARGSFLSFNMGFYTQDADALPGQTVLGAVLRSFLSEHIDSLAYRSHDTGLIEDGSRFRLLGAGELLDSPEKYTLLADSQQDIALDKNILTNLSSDQERYQYIKDHYVGTCFVRSHKKLPGFTSKEIYGLDTVGRFTEDKVLFLTFDDWGTEQSLNELLYVLEKHDVKATFFITTQHVDSNPNLLRAIAVQGHQVGSHTNGHLPLSDSANNGTATALTLTEEEAQALRQDVVDSYNILYKYIGDVTADGKKALTPIFRPPTLAVSRIGISQIFDVGYRYSVSGDMSTNDYKAESYEDMCSQLENGISDGGAGGDYIWVRPGSVIVMHMLENARYTAQALDTMIPIWKEQGYSFARLDDYLKD